MSGIHSVSIVGTGNIAHHLGKAFRDAGVPISDIYGRNSASVKELGLKLNCAVVASLDDLSGDLILLCVSDDAVETERFLVFSILCKLSQKTVTLTLVLSLFSLKETVANMNRN
jgi:predicted dinucleotide-utilizing enzyme